MALPAYRTLLRAIRLAFQGPLKPPPLSVLLLTPPNPLGDPPLLTAATTQSRTAFDSSRTLDPSDPATHKMIQHARDVARVLRENVVQGERVVDGGGGEVYREFNLGVVGGEGRGKRGLMNEMRNL